MRPHPFSMYLFRPVDRPQNFSTAGGRDLTNVTLRHAAGLL
jgi:hypothetical protein